MVEETPEVELDVEEDIFLVQEAIARPAVRSKKITLHFMFEILA